MSLLAPCFFFHGTSLGLECRLDGNAFQPRRQGQLSMVMAKPQDGRTPGVLNDADEQHCPCSQGHPLPCQPCLLTLRLLSEREVNVFLIFFLRFFLMRTIFIVFIGFVTILLLFYVLVFWPRGMWDLSSPTRDRTRTPCIGRRSLNHWIAREVPYLI